MSSNKNPPETAAGDADSFSSDSDDEFLTMRDDGTGGNVDRESLIRKKLLESFYGKASVENETYENDDDRKGRKPPNRSASHDTYDDGDDSDEEGRDRRPSRRVDPTAAADLDSPDFDAPKHTAAYVLNYGVHPLLETEESLACQVRTLDSSMQTLVYENYSRFIEATDAIRSIGVNVQANATNLQKLSTSIVTVGDAARSVETSCGALRDAVVEKLRVKRLLQRLDSLLKLPSTLRENIDRGRYRWASKSYLTAYHILNKHSAGFESLQRIEADCYRIMEDMLVDVRRRLLHWSGNAMVDAEHYMDDDCDIEQATDGDTAATSSAKSENRALFEDPPDPPASIGEIFECAGTIVLMLSHENTNDAETVTPSSNAEGETSILDRPATITRMASRVEFNPGLTMDECKTMTLNSCLRLVERYLDVHHIEMQDAIFGDEVEGPMGASNARFNSAELVLPSLHEAPESLQTTVIRSSKLIPTKVLDSISEAASLYNITFPDVKGESPSRLSSFVSNSFRLFLQHVRSELLEQVAQMSTKHLLPVLQVRLQGSQPDQAADDSGGSENAGEDQVGPDERAFERISQAISLLLESVRHLGSELSLPEVAIDSDLAASLVDQAVALSESMVQRRVEQKFYWLRFRVIHDCLAPFCRKALQSLEGDIRPTSTGEDCDSVAKVIQLSSVALSDSLQLVDDTIRSILANPNSVDVQSSSLASTEDGSMVKVAVEESSNRFAIWLAITLENVAGCESSDPIHMIDVYSEEDRNHFSTHSAPDRSSHDISNEDDSEWTDLVETCTNDLLDELDAFGTLGKVSDLILAIVEMCRVAQGSVADDIAASIATHTGIVNKQRAAKPGLFATPSGDRAAGNVNPISNRFRLAASRVIHLYALNRGNNAGEAISSGLVDLSRDISDDSDGPRSGVCFALGMVKTTSLECANLFGEPNSGGPVPGNLEDEYSSLTTSRHQHLRSSGLAVDVERMFAEKVFVYPQSFEIAEFQRNAVVAVVLKTCLKCLIENSRLVRFSVSGYRQFLVDIEFLRFLLPHYVNDDVRDGSNNNAVLETLISEANKSAKDRCDGAALIQDTSTEINQARASIRQFMFGSNHNQAVLDSILIPEES